MPDYSSQQQALNRRRQLAAAMQQQSMLPIEQPNVPGANVNALQGLTPIIQALLAGLTNRKLDKQQQAIDTGTAGERTSAAEAAVPYGTADAQVMSSPVGEPQVMPRLAGPEDQAARAGLVQALASSNPQAQQLGQTRLQDVLATRRQGTQQAQEMARLLSQQQFTSGQNAAQQSSEDARANALRKTQREIGLKPSFEQGGPGQAQGVFYPETGQFRQTGETPIATPSRGTDPYGTREIQRDGKVYIQTYAKDDPQAKTLSEVLKGPVPEKNEPGTYQPLIDQQSGQITGFVNAKTSTFKAPEDIKGMPEKAYRAQISAERQKMQENAKSGLRAVAKLREELKKPGALVALRIPGSPTERTARAARGEMVDVMTRLRTGAALNKDEQKFYNDQAPGLIDALFSDPATIEYKLSIFENEFKGLTGESSSGNVEELEFGPDGKLRAKTK